MKILSSVLCAAISFGTAALAQAQADNNTPISATTTTINSKKVDYAKTVLPILQNSCFACHVPGTKVTLPTDPDLAAKAKKEISKGVEELTMGNSFPFTSDDAPAKQLKHLYKTLSKGFMPPHSQSQLGLGQPLSDQDRKTLLAWVAQEQTTQK